MPGLLDRFTVSLAPGDEAILAHARAFAAWQSERQAGEFLPRGSDDDVALRTYLLHLRETGAGQATVRRVIASLRRFYAWAQTEGLIESTPFDVFNFDRPLLSRDQIRRRRDALGADPREREIARLRALHHLAEQLNRSADVRSALEAALQAVVQVMGLRTAWVFLHTSALGTAVAPGAHPHDFALAAAHDLPSGLEQDDGRFLRCPPDCHCQFLLREGQLTRAVNIVECTRLEDAAEAAGDTRGLLFHASVPLWIEGRTAGVINVAADEWQFLSAADLQLLSAVGAQVTSAIERARLYDLAQAQRARLERELEMARAVQASLLPRALPAIPGYSLAADWRAAREVAGDFYDVFALPGGRWALLIADVSDKGAPAALYMAMTRSLIRAAAERAPDPAAMFDEVNRALLAQSSAEMFVTAFCAVLDPAAHAVRYACAGHNPPMLRRASGVCAPLPRGGVALGVIPGAPVAEASLTLAPGEALILYTDGVTEAQNPPGEEYGLARFAAALSAAPARAPDLLARLLADLTAFTAAAEQTDDITLLIIARE